MSNRVGVLALQGAFALHIEACESLGFDAIEVRTPEQLATVDRLIMPGGESTTMSMMLDRNEMRDPIARRLSDGMPTFGTCAGMILLAVSVSDGRSDQKSFAAIDIDVRRNGYGRQNQSFSDALDISALSNSSLGPSSVGEAAPSDGFHAVFIRAPMVERVGADVEVLAEYDAQPVLCQQNSVLVASFHPELSPDRALHRYFCSLPL